MNVLRDVIADLLEKAERWGHKKINEADTKALFIEPMLGVLGWDVHDLEMVSREYRVYDGTLLDYALKLDDAVRLIVEAKPLSKSLGDKQFIAQTVNYANNEGIVWCVLTNGLRYRVYKSNEPAEMERKLLFDVDLKDAREESTAEEVARRLTYLSRDSIESGSLDEWGDSRFTDERVKSVVTSLLTTTPTRLVNMVSEQLGGQGALPRDKVKESLRRMATLLAGDETASGSPPVTRVTPSAKARAPTTPAPAGWVQLDKLTVAPYQVPPKQVRFPDGTVQPLRAWKDLLAQVAKLLVENGAVSSKDCPVKLRPSAKRALLDTASTHPNGKSFFQPVQVGSLWLETNESARDLHHLTLFLIKYVGHNPGDYSVQ